MAKVQWSNGIDFVSGALNKVKKDGQHSHEKMLLGTHRTAATTSNCCTRVYIRKPVERTSPASSNELWARERFGAVCAAVALRKKDLTKVAQDNAAFLAQKDQAGGKKTLRAYLWSLELATYDQAHPRS